MNYLNKYLNSESRRKLFNYLRPSSYNTHPELKIKGIPTKRWKMLMTMRDLRLWVEENAPHSSRAQMYKAEIYQINHEINYLQLRALLKACLVWFAVLAYCCYWGPKHWKGAITTQSRPP